MGHHLLALQVDQQENLHQDLWIVQRELESRSIGLSNMCDHL